MRCAAALSAILFLIVPALAQDAATPARTSSTGDANHGLVLTLALDPTPEPLDSAPLKECRAHHPPLACVPLTITLKNEGKEAILSYFAT